MLEAIIARLKLDFYAQGEYIIYQDDQSTEMYFIVEVCSPLLLTLLYYDHTVSVSVVLPASLCSCTHECVQRMEIAGWCAKTGIP